MMNWKIWAKKVGITALAVLIAGGMAEFGDNALWLALLPALKAFHNAYKHW